MGRGEPSISVVTPAYNAERFLDGTIRSALAQSLPPLEIIVVDDGSTDRTGEIARAFGSPVRCIRQDNAGPAAARNRGVREARGEFVAFLDADDWWYPHHLEDAARVLAAHRELEWFCSAFDERTQDGKTRRRTYHGALLKADAYIADYYRAQVECWFAWTGTMVMRRQAVLDIGGFDESLRGPEDIDLWFRIALRHPQVGYSRRAGAVYRRHAASLMGSRTGSELRPLLERIEKLERVAVEAGPEAAKRSEPLIIAWVGGLIRLALYEGRRELARDFYTRYRRRLALAERLLLGAARFIPGAWLARLYAILLFKLALVRRAFRRLLMKASGRLA
jgi:glycosyltransferase involved in cell wall biosynthesis